MQFCPYDGSLLRVDQLHDLAFKCFACPYVYRLEEEQEIKVRTTLTPKAEDDVLGGADAWKNVDQCDARCPKCENHRAYYMQFQTRSADEPMTVFYKCTACGSHWKE
jgi:DNA-directed RNA polymerase III subunit RPC11